MVLVWILLWTLAIITLLNDYKTASTRWLSAMLFITGLGAFTTVLQDNIFPLLIQYKVSEVVINRIEYTIIYLSTFVHAIGPYIMLIYGLSYSEVIPRKGEKVVFCILLIPSILSSLILPVKDNELRTQGELMIYFTSLSLWAVPYILGSSILVVYSYFKEKRYLKKKYKFLTMLMVTPCLVYVALSNFLLRAIGIQNNWSYFTIIIPLQFIGFLYFAKEYGVLGVRLRFEKHRFAFEKMLEFVSDSFVALDEKLNVIEVNKVFYDNFMIKDKECTNFHDLIMCSNIYDYKESLIKIIGEAQKGNTEFIEIAITTKMQDKYYNVDANPVIIKNEYYGIVLVFKDITVYRKNLQLIKENQLQLIEKERLLTLSHLIGGVAHNLKTPLMSSSGGIHIMKRDIDKIYESIQNNNVDNEQVRFLMDEITQWHSKTKRYLIYMSDVIDTLKGQVKEIDEAPNRKFTIKELVDKISILMSYEFIKSKCSFIKDIKIDYEEEIKGDVNSLLQVLDNLIINAIEASNENGEITLGIDKVDDQVVFYVKNIGQGMPKEIQESIFNKMITTKGKNGTGLGLYISKAIIKGRFSGDIFFETFDNETTFFVKIPQV